MITNMLSVSDTRGVAMVATITSLWGNWAYGVKTLCVITQNMSAALSECQLFVMIPPANTSLWTKRVSLEEQLNFDLSSFLKQQMLI